MTVDSGTAMRFVTEADWIPSFRNYLLDLDRDDLIAELVQNDLDQDATRTVISFEEDQLVCEGNGKPVGDEGWQRLRKIQGAGGSVPAKRGKIGVKNHGLKTAFTVGDELQLMSAGRAIVQTLYAKGRNKLPYPGASPEPIADPQAPADGCRIVLRYRNTDIEPPQGEANVLGAVSVEEIDDLFLSACTSAPEQFAGIVSPEVAPCYEIVLRHWRLGEARFSFSCTRPRKIGKRIEIFRRRCAVSGTVSPLPKGLQEQAARRLVPLKGRLTQRVADFFRLWEALLYRGVLVGGPVRQASNRDRTIPLSNRLPAKFTRSAYRSQHVFQCANRLGQQAPRPGPERSDEPGTARSVRIAADRCACTPRRASLGTRRFEPAGAEPGDGRSRRGNPAYPGRACRAGRYACSEMAGRGRAVVQA